MKKIAICLVILISCSGPSVSSELDGCDKAAHQVMEMFWNGVELKDSVDKALISCLEPATKGNVTAQVHMGMLHILKNDRKENQESFYWLLKAAENGDLDSQFQIGKMYENGNVVEKNEDRAINWYKKAANKGEVIAFRKLGKIYLTETKKDIDKSIYWFEKSAEECDKLSIIKLMEIYSNKFESNVGNPQKAKYWDDKYTSCNMKK